MDQDLISFDEIDGLSVARKPMIATPSSVARPQQVTSSPVSVSRPTSPPIQTPLATQAASSTQQFPVDGRTSDSTRRRSLPAQPATSRSPVSRQSQGSRGQSNGGQDDDLDSEIARLTGRGERQDPWSGQERPSSRLDDDLDQEIANITGRGQRQDPWSGQERPSSRLDFAAKRENLPKERVIKPQTYAPDNAGYKVDFMPAFAVESHVYDQSVDMGVLSDKNQEYTVRTRDIPQCVKVSDYKRDFGFPENFHGGYDGPGNVGAVLTVKRLHDDDVNLNDDQSVIQYATNVEIKTLLSFYGEAREVLDNKYKISDLQDAFLIVKAANEYARMRGGVANPGYNGVPIRSDTLMQCAIDDLVKDLKTHGVDISADDLSDISRDLSGLYQEIANQNGLYDPSVHRLLTDPEVVSVGQRTDNGRVVYQDGQRFANVNYISWHRAMTHIADKDRISEDLVSQDLMLDRKVAIEPMIAEISSIINTRVDINKDRNDNIIRMNTLANDMSVVAHEIEKLRNYIGTVGPQEKRRLEPKMSGLQREYRILEIEHTELHDKLDDMQSVDQSEILNIITGYVDKFDGFDRTTKDKIVNEFMDSVEAFLSQSMSHDERSHSNASSRSSSRSSNGDEMDGSSGHPGFSSSTTHSMPVYSHLRRPVQPHAQHGSHGQDHKDQRGHSRESQYQESGSQRRVDRNSSQAFRPVTQAHAQHRSHGQDRQTTRPDSVIHGRTGSPARSFSSTPSQVAGGFAGDHDRRTRARTQDPLGSHTDRLNAESSRSSSRIHAM